MLEKNKGYWKVGDLYFDVKINAIMAAQASDRDIEFVFNDHYYDQYDWTQEPKEDIHELYLRRARQLREKYKTLILSFSGGADSTTILKTCLDNGIKIDVVYVREYTELMGLDRNTMLSSQEKIHITWPTIEKLKQEGHDFEVIAIDPSRYLLDMGHTPDWIFRLNTPRLDWIEYVAPRSVLHPALAKYDDPSTCVMMGIDKPCVKLLKNKVWYWTQPDWHHSLIHPGFNSMAIEPFFWTADMPEIQIKQSHLIKNFFEKNTDLFEKLYDPLLGFNLKATLIPIIYPKYYDFTPQETCPYIDVIQRECLNPWDFTFGTKEDMQKYPHYDIWKKGCDLVDLLVHDRWKLSGSIWNNGLKTLFAKPRWLGK
jgi:hypothetical protein